MSSTFYGAAFVPLATSRLLSGQLPLITNGIYAPITGCLDCQEVENHHQHSASIQSGGEWRQEVQVEPRYLKKEVKEEGKEEEEEEEEEGKHEKEEVLETCGVKRTFFQHLYPKKRVEQAMCHRLQVTEDLCRLYNHCTIKTVRAYN